MMTSADPGGALALERLSPADSAAFGQVYAIYVDIFPSSERKPLDWLKRNFADPDYEFLAHRQGGQIVAFAILRHLHGVSAVLLDYMGVAKQMQGQGLGSAMFRSLTLRPETADRPILLEVEDERGGDADGVRAARKAFYRALGCREIDGFDYRMPKVSGRTPPPMNLLVYRHSSDSRIERSVVEGWLTAIYAQVYAKPAGDPGLRQMAAGLPEQPVLI